MQHYRCVAAVHGCMLPGWAGDSNLAHLALNHDAAATAHNASACKLARRGCTSRTALNYSPHATPGNGAPCYEPRLGCLDAAARNFNCSWPGHAHCDAEAPRVTVHDATRCIHVAASPPPPPPPFPTRREGEVLLFELSVALLCLEPLSHWDAAALQAHSARAALAFGVTASLVVSNATSPAPFGAARRTRRRLQNARDANSLVVASAAGLDATRLEAAYAGWAELAPSAYAASLHFNVTALAAPSFKEASTLVEPPPPPDESLPAWLWPVLGGASSLLLCAAGLVTFRLVLARRRGSSPAPVAPHLHPRAADEEKQDGRTPSSMEENPSPVAAPLKGSHGTGGNITSY